MKTKMAEIDDKNAALEHYLKLAKDDEEKKARIKTGYNLSLHDFTQFCSTQLELRCPPELPYECEDGSCAKSPAGCPPIPPE